LLLWQNPGTAERDSSRAHVGRRRIGTPHSLWVELHRAALGIRSGRSGIDWPNPNETGGVL
jgi:hypothetical protein